MPIIMLIYEIIDFQIFRYFFFYQKINFTPISKIYSVYTVDNNRTDLPVRG